MIWLLVLLLPAAVLVAAPVADWLDRRADERDRETWDRWLRGGRL